MSILFMFTGNKISNTKVRLWRLLVVKAQLVDGLPSGYVRFLLDLDGKPGARRHGFKMEGTLTTKGTSVEKKKSNFGENIHLMTDNLSHFLNKGFSYLLFSPL